MQNVTAPPERARFEPVRYFAWLALGLAAACLLGWLAFQIGQFFAPLVLFPLIAGLALGGVALVLLQVCNQGHRWGTIAGLVAMTLMFVVTQHFVSYRKFQAAVERNQQRIADQSNSANSKDRFAAIAANLVPEPPASLLDYLQQEATRGRRMFGNVTAQGGWAWASWILDGVLVLAAAAFVVIPATRQPYCNKCHSWYHVVRSAPLDAHRQDAIITACGLANETPFPARWFALLSCRGGCGPDGLELVREVNDRGPGPKQKRIWLNTAQRQAVTAILDQPPVRGGTES